jgi:tetratricopeptide (TPR) repeat protein
MRRSGWRLPLAIAAMLVAGASSGSTQAPERLATDVYTRALGLEQQGDRSGALALLWEAAGLTPHDAEIQNRLGEALERIGALEAATDAYRRALLARPAFRRATNNLVLVLVKSGKGPEALDHARRLVAAAPSEPENHYTLGLTQSELNVSDALASFRRVLDLAPRHTLARFNLALVLKRVDRLAEATDELNRLLAIEPRSEAHYTLGVIFWQQGDLDRAAAALRAAVEIDPRNAEAYHTLGTVAKARRDWPAAAAALQRAIALRPDVAGPHYTLGQVLQLAGDDAGARAHFEENERLRQRETLEREASVWTFNGLRRLDQGDALRAIDHFRRATTLFETYAPAYYHLGRALERLGEREASRAAFVRARQLNPSLVPPVPD